MKSHLRREHNQAFLEVEKGDENALEERKKRVCAASQTCQLAEITESFYKFLFRSGVAVSAITENKDLYEDSDSALM